MNPDERKEEDPLREVEARFTRADVAANDLDNAAWEGAQILSIERYWSGEAAPVGRHARAQILWSEKSLALRFICRQTEPLIVSPQPQALRKTLGLWDRDVCELFIAPETVRPERYYEFEAAPTGEWLDLQVQLKADVRETDWDYHSGMTAAARVAPGEVVIAMRIPWEAFGRAAPRAGERWRANLFRCVGAGEGRGYLAWRPTYTEEPSFHVPAAFGWIRFKK
jgi:hypothetical protein